MKLFSPKDQLQTLGLWLVGNWENGRMISLADEVIKMKRLQQNQETGMREDPVDSFHAYGTIWSMFDAVVSIKYRRWV